MLKPSIRSCTAALASVGKHSQLPESALKVPSPVCHTNRNSMPPNARQAFKHARKPYHGRDV
eukprot:682169-Pleurochrysis_carterae.AAC.1